MLYHKLILQTWPMPRRPMTHDYDLIIVGNGLAGASLAIALQHLPLRIAILDKQLHQATAPNTADIDPRPITLTHTSQRILATLGHWQPLTSHAKAIQHLQISEQGHLGQINLLAKELKLTALGYILPYNQLYQHLQTTLSNHPHIKHIQIEQLTSINNNADDATISYIDKNNTPCSISTPLLVVADGTHSTCRQLLKIKSQPQDHGDRALVFEASLGSSQYSNQIAYQRFTPQGSIAWLPSWQPNRARLVWTISKHNLAKITDYTEQDFLQHFNAVYQGRTAIITACTKTGDFPLNTMYVPQATAASVVLIGNAAHSLYPITAQGFNLTLLDIATLAEVLTETYHVQNTLGDTAALQRYQTWSTTAQKNISQGTRAIDAIFGLRLPLMGPLRGLGMLFTDLCSFSKHRLAQQFLGHQQQMPKLGCGIPLSLPNTRQQLPNQLKPFNIGPFNQYSST